MPELCAPAPGLPLCTQRRLRGRLPGRDATSKAIDNLYAKTSTICMRAMLCPILWIHDPSTSVSDVA